jgi:hypothetical protein
VTTISAKIIADSVNEYDNRLTTMELRYPRFIHSEFMTHRQFSRNASSSRAIPVKRLIDDIVADPVVPLFWGANQKGMQAGLEHDAKVLLHGNLQMSDLAVSRDVAWLNAMQKAVAIARSFDKAGYHKQLVNRLLEPFSHITVVVSSTQWANFFALRDHPDAEPHMQMLARAMKAAMAESVPILRIPDPKGNAALHLPYVTDDERHNVLHVDESSIDPLICASVARCARTSYKTHDGRTPTIEEDIALFGRLVGGIPIHASPAEHVAMPARWDYERCRWEKSNLLGNFVGWWQFRKTLRNECVHDEVEP